MIRGALRIQYLAFLRSKGLVGMDDFLFTFISSLLERRQMETALERQRREQLQLSEGGGAGWATATASSYSAAPAAGSVGSAAAAAMPATPSPHPALQTLRRGTGKVGADWE
jgi:hypothetical protein